MAKIKKTIKPLRKSTENAGSIMAGNKCETCGKSCSTVRRLRIHRELDHGETFGIWSYAEKKDLICEKEANNDAEIPNENIAEDDTNCEKENQNETEEAPDNADAENFASMKCYKHSVRYCTFCYTSYNSQTKSKSSKTVRDAKEAKNDAGKTTEAPGNESSYDEKNENQVKVTDAKNQQQNVSNHNFRMGNISNHIL